MIPRGAWPFIVFAAVALIAFTLLAGCDPDSAVDYECPDGKLVFYQDGAWKYASPQGTHVMVLPDSESGLVQFCEMIEVLP